MLYAHNDRRLTTHGSLSRHIILILYIFIISCCFCSQSFANPDYKERIDIQIQKDGVSDYGPIVRRAIADAIAAGDSEVVFGPGRFVVTTEATDGYCFKIDNAKSLLIRGQGPETEIIIVNPRLGGFLFYNCDRVVLSDLVIDYDVPPFTQGTIVAVDADGGTFDFKVQQGYWLLDEEFFKQAPVKFGVIIDPQKRTLKAGVSDHIFLDKWSHVSERVWRLKAGAGYKQILNSLEPGDRYVQLARTTNLFAIQFKKCKDGIAKNVVVHASPSAAMVLFACDKSLVKNLKVCFRPGTDRLITTNADGVHCQQNRKGPSIEGCFFEGLADDGINIYSPPDSVIDVLSDVDFVVSDKTAIRSGDLLQITDPQIGEIIGELIATEVKTHSLGYAIKLQHPVTEIKQIINKGQTVRIYNLSQSGCGFVIKDNYIRDNRRHGILVRAGGGLIQRNIIENVGGHPIVLSNEPDWPEGPIPFDIIIQDNVLRGGGYTGGYGNINYGASIQIRGLKLGNTLAEGCGIHDIKIIDNYVENAPGTAVYVGSAHDVSIERLSVLGKSGPFPTYKKAVISLENVYGIKIGDINIKEARCGVLAGLEIKPTVRNGESEVEVRNFDASLPEGCPVILDNRPGTMKDTK